MSSSYLQNVTVVGAGGQIGGHIVQQLLTQGKHKVSALTRPGSGSALPRGLQAIHKVDYDDQEALVAALKGQDVLVITLSATAPPETSIKLVDAAVLAGIKYVVPNEWGSDRAQVQLGKDLLLAEGQIKLCEYIVSKGIKWISVGCAFWYEFSLSNGDAGYGFDLVNRKVTFYDDGNTKITTTTWPQTGLAVARLLALPLTTIEDFDNSQVLITSFHVSQRDMLDSILRVTGDKESDWTIQHEDSKERFERGRQLMYQGDYLGFAIAMYARGLSKDDPMAHESKVVNKLLGLPEEDLDTATRVAISLAQKRGV
jgi:hypothetical protein